MHKHMHVHTQAHGDKVKLASNTSNVSRELLTERERVREKHNEERAGSRRRPTIQW